LENAAKLPADIVGRRGVQRVLSGFDQRLTKVDQEGSLGVISDVFEVMARVDRRLTKVNSVDLIIRVKEPDLKPGASQPTPLKQNLVPRFDNKIRVTLSNRTRVTKMEDILACISRQREFR
jgi:hypothetical protein